LVFDGPFRAEPGACLYRKPKPGRSVDGARQGWRLTGCLQSAEWAEKTVHLLPRTSACGCRCNSQHRLARSDANAASPKTMRWSTHSRRIEPIIRSAKPFCEGEADAPTISEWGTAGGGHLQERIKEAGQVVPVRELPIRRPCGLGKLAQSAPGIEANGMRQGSHSRNFLGESVVPQTRQTAFAASLRCINVKAAGKDHRY
jgi:hypothetical protein